ncbi:MULTISPECIES: MBL fold metallo-hydrolase [unclassified Virgibacillus]|uniref:MBL fold metallo-hydrolase n=1 Tax=unclassified Virgibacillus TaxID=2620237 RepID=UPI0024DE419A|nr:MBL fold metallo-hydrolase [Virgibacillus sp. LDC-1]
MKLTVVGHWGGYPAKNNATSCYLLEKDSFSLLIDVGSGALSCLQDYKEIMEIDAVLLSHYHQDHIADIGVLQYAWLVNSYLTEDKRVLPIYGHREDAAAFSVLTHECTKGIAYDPTRVLEIGPFSITFLQTVHPVPCYGMRISDGERTIVYTADTSYQKEWIPFSKGADLLITDCNFYAEQDGSKAGHMNSKEGAMIAQASGVHELLLSHLPQYGEQTQLAQEAKRDYNGRVHLACKGFTWQK